MCNKALHNHLFCEVVVRAFLDCLCLSSLPWAWLSSRLKRLKLFLVCYFKTQYVFFRILLLLLATKQ